MKKIKNSISITLLLFGLCLNAQDYKFGKVSKEELEEKYYPKDSSAAAVVLYRNERIWFQYYQKSGFQVVTNVHERIKIYNKDGFDYATKAEQLYKNGTDAENLSGLKAFTYNLVDDKIVKDKLEKSGQFQTSLNKYRNEEKFTLPNIKEGSVVEYEYEIHSPFYYNIAEIALQYDIPIKKEEISIATPEYFVFKPFMKGYLMIQPKYSTNSGTINIQSKSRSQSVRNIQNTKYSNSQIDYKVNTVQYNVEHVPALKEEPYVNYMDNYRSAVKYELQYVNFPNAPIKSYTSTWESVIKNIYKSESFGGQLKGNRFFNEELEKLKNASSSQSELALSIFKHIQERMTWNKYFGYYVDKGIKDAYKERTGNIADINLLLLAILQEAGLEANPVLISTRSNGVPLFPTMEGFNYVIASVQLGEGTVLLDASNKYTKPNLLPTRALNWLGRLIKKDETYETINLSPQSISAENTVMMVDLSSEGKLNGKLRKVYNEYNAYQFRNTNIAISEDSYLEKLENRNHGMEISDYRIKNKKTVGKPITESYAFNLDNQVDVINDKIYFSPMFFMATEENPFKLNERNYPVDFSYPWQEKYIINVNIPEGYHLLSKPKDISLVMPNNMGSFKYQIMLRGTSLQLSVDLMMNQAVVGTEQYGGLKELYSKVVEKQVEKVVLTKVIGETSINELKEGK